MESIITTPELNYSGIEAINVNNETKNKSENPLEDNNETNEIEEILENALCESQESFLDFIGYDDISIASLNQIQKNNDDDIITTKNTNNNDSNNNITEAKNNIINNDINDINNDILETKNNINNGINDINDINNDINNNNDNDILIYLNKIISNNDSLESKISINDTNDNSNSLIFKSITSNNLIEPEKNMNNNDEIQQNRYIDLKNNENIDKTCKSKQKNKTNKTNKPDINNYLKIKKSNLLKNAEVPSENENKNIIDILNNINNHIKSNDDSFQYSISTQNKK